MSAPRWIPKRRPAGDPAVEKAPTPRRVRVVPRVEAPELATGSGRDRIEQWFARRGWAPHTFQRATWDAYQRGESGLVHVPTGAGKTYAAYLGALADLIDHDETGADGLRLLYVTPLRAVSRDVELALRAPVEALGLAMRIESRTGDTKESTRAKQRKSLPGVLITTPESLSLLLASSTAPEMFAGLRGVLIDEWHELLGTKRGTQVELGLARVRRFAPGVRTWAMTATIDDLNEAARAAVGARHHATLITASMDREIVLETLIPCDIDTFPWAGHLGMSMLDRVLSALDGAQTALVFTNTRFQSERWYQAIVAARPEIEEQLALHHGSLEREERERVEAGLKSGALRVVVCTSSLDLGVDFPAVDRVVQIGSPKGISRLMQRAGRASHRPGAPCHIVCVPTHALELIEFAAAREALERKELEGRSSLSKPLDVLVQHVVTCALGGGVTPASLLDEVRSTTTYEHLTDDEFSWVLSLVRDGGRTLRAYPDYHRVVEEDGVLRVTNDRIARMHRSSIGTIVSESSIAIQLIGGPRLGTVEEGFVSKLRSGDRFVFAARLLEFARLKETVAYVRPARRPTSVTPVWSGGRMPLSTALAASVRRVLGRYSEIPFSQLTPKRRTRSSTTNDTRSRGTSTSKRGETPEIEAAYPILAAQARLSKIPATNEVLAEVIHTDEGTHLFVFPFEGRLVHEGLAALLSLRMSRKRKATFSLTVDDYGLEVFSADDFPFEKMLDDRGLFSSENLVDDVIESINVSELARRQFREIARVSGLVFHGYPGAAKSMRQVQTSSTLLFDVFVKYDPGNLLVEQARREVIEAFFEQGRLASTLARIASSQLTITHPKRPTPLAFPLLVQRIGATLTSESLVDRIEKMKQQWSEP